MIYVEEFYSAFLGSVDWTLKSILFQVPGTKLFLGTNFDFNYHMGFRNYFPLEKKPVNYSERFLVGFVLYVF